MKKITVDLKSRSYPIYIEPGLVKKIPSYLSEYNKGQKWVIISQQNIMEIIGYDIEKYLIEKGFDCIHFTLPIGEAAKSMNEYNRAISQMIENECDRKTFIVSLGGGA
jgi:3-dehydroquinate synthetase